MKAAPVIDAFKARSGVGQVLVHTGQHYDANMSEIFFKQLGLPEPDVNLDVGSGSHAVQTAQIMLRIEQVLLNEKPDLVLVYGDVNSTAAAAMVCAKLLIPVGHVEAGLRSFDRSMPEEINRVITDQISDYLFTPSKDGDANLVREGVDQQKIHFVGNVMIDTLVRLTSAATADRVWAVLPNSIRAAGHAEEPTYCLVTLHRPSNVDAPQMLARITGALNAISRQVPVVFPVHPRTRKKMLDNGLTLQGQNGFHLLEPMGYLDFLSLQKGAAVVITDSGGIQEETTFLGVPCLTVRQNTERPVTVEQGTNVLVGQDMERLQAEVKRILDGGAKNGRIPAYWDGKAGERIADILC
jgi:UDP-N-acetylglucosamine 2-epimerase (non-hydrolysing)